MGWKYWGIPLAGLCGFVFAFTWDMLDGPDDVPPWVVEECD